MIRVALPKGRLLNDTARLTTAAGWELSDYSEGARLYHLSSRRFKDLAGKILHEKDIPVQVALGNYDIGICGLDWIRELTVKYPSSGLVRVRDLGYGSLSLFLATNRGSKFAALSSLCSSEQVIAIASEYPNLAESLALDCRARRFNIFPLWGTAEIYPPENADLVLIALTAEKPQFPPNLVPVARVLDSTACVIANKASLENLDLSPILSSLFSAAGTGGTVPLNVQPGPETAFEPMPPESVRLALPDGHAQKHVVNILNRANIKITDYPSATGNRRPLIDIPGVTVKLVRPQDMPLQVANNKFDMAITGLDWVKEHLYQFPSSPVTPLVDLKYSRVRIVAALHNDLNIDDSAGLRRMAVEKGLRVRVASEYVRIADQYARDNHLGMYRVVPTWGATEAFLPDDADVLIENTETGGTLKRHNLKIIDTLFESTAWLIVGKAALNSEKARTIRDFAERLKQAVED